MIKVSKNKSSRSAKRAGAHKSKRTRSAVRRERTGKAIRSIVKGIKIEVREEGGALGWLLPMIEGTFTPLVPRGTGAPAGAVSMARSSLKQGTAVLMPADPTLWRDVLLEYKRRKAAALAPSAMRAGTMMRPAPRVPGARNWMPLGPS